MFLYVLIPNMTASGKKHTVVDALLLNLPLSSVRKNLLFAFLDFPRCSKSCPRVEVHTCSSEMRGSVVCGLWGVKFQIFVFFLFSMEITGNLRIVFSWVDKIRKKYAIKF